MKVLKICLMCIGIIAICVSVVSRGGPLLVKYRENQRIASLAAFEAPGNRFDDFADLLEAYASHKEVLVEKIVHDRGSKAIPEEFRKPLHSHEDGPLQEYVLGLKKSEMTTHVFLKRVGSYMFLVCDGEYYWHDSYYCEEVPWVTSDSRDLAGWLKTVVDKVTDSPVQG